MSLFDTTIPIGYETSLPLTGGKRLTIMEDNSFKVQGMSEGSIVRAGRIICPFLTEAQKDTVMSFHSANKDLEWQFDNPHDGNRYDLHYLDPEPVPIKLPDYTPARYNIVMNVMGAKQ